MFIKDKWTSRLNYWIKKKHDFREVIHFCWDQFNTFHNKSSKDSCSDKQTLGDSSSLNLIPRPTPRVLTQVRSDLRRARAWCGGDSRTRRTLQSPEMSSNSRAQWLYVRLTLIQLEWCNLVCVKVSKTQFQARISTIELLRKVLPVFFLLSKSDKYHIQSNSNHDSCEHFRTKVDSKSWFQLQTTQIKMEWVFFAIKQGF